MARKLKLFVAHSFEEETEAEKGMSDIEVANWFIRLMKKRPLSFEVLTGSKPAPGPISDKILADIADSSGVIGIFTKRLYDESLKKWFPSQFVLCECACAIGFYYNTNKLIAGFYEEGIDPQDLALITIGGLELVPFRRDKLEEDKSKFIDYLKQIPEFITSGSPRISQLMLLQLPYSQQRLYKIYTIYRNGNVTVQNINKMVIHDSERFNIEFGGQIEHEIWHSRITMPPFSEMIASSIEERREKPFLQGLFRYRNQKKMETPLRIELKEEKEGKIYFDAGFVDKDGNPQEFKNGDTIQYQYAWGIPKAYATNEEALEPPGPRGDINESAYNQAEVIGSHGLIRNLVLELRFERGKKPMFSKSPFAQHTASFSDLPPWSAPKDMTLIEEEDHAMWFETYRITEQNFQGRIRVLWRPSSQKWHGLGMASNNG